MDQRGNDRRWLLFLALAYGISWGTYAVAKWVFGASSPTGWMLTGALFMLGPTAAALIVRRLAPGIPWRTLGLTFQGIRWKWTALAVACALALPLLTLLFNFLLGNVAGLHGFGTTEISLGMMQRTIGEQLEAAGATSEKTGSVMGLLGRLSLPAGVVLLLLLVAGAVAGCTVDLPFALGEEIGWRGLLLDRTRHWGLAKHVLVTGIAWGLWHAPLILEGHNYPGHPWTGVFWMCALTTAMAVPLAWVRVRSGCIWAPGMMHGTVNATAGAVMLFTAGAGPLFGSPVGVSGVLALIVVGAVLFLADRGFPQAFRNRAEAQGAGPLTAAPSPGS